MRPVFAKPSEAAVDRSFIERLSADAVGALRTIPANAFSIVHSPHREVERNVARNSPARGGRRHGKVELGHLCQTVRVNQHKGLETPAPSRCGDSTVNSTDFVTIGNHIRAHPAAG